MAQTHGPSYEVQTGRRDGVVSNVSMADNMPDIGDSIQQLKSKFFGKGLSEKDLVVLSGTANKSLLLSFTHIHKHTHTYASRFGALLVGRHFKGYEPSYYYGKTFFFWCKKRINISNFDTSFDLALQFSVVYYFEMNDLSLTRLRKVLVELHVICIR